MTELKNCPMPGCGSVCEIGDGPWECKNVECSACSHMVVGETEDEAIAAHNALCADVELARNLRKFGAARFGCRLTITFWGGKDVNADLKYFDNGDKRATVEVVKLDAALAELAKKIGGSDER